MQKALRRNEIPKLAKLQSSLNRPATSSVAYTLSALISRGAAFLFTPIFTRLYTPEQFGAYSIFNSFLSIIFILGSLEICSGVLIRLLVSEEHSRERLVYSVAKVMLVCCSFVCVGFFIINRVFGTSRFFGFNFSLLVCALSRTLVTLYVASSKFYYKIGAVVAINLTESLLPPIITLIIYRFQSSADMLVSIRAFVYSFIMISMAIPIFIRIRKRAAGTKKGEENYTAKILKAALPMLPYYISMIVIAQGDKVLIGNTLGEGVLGGYGVAYSLGGAVTMLSSGLLGVLMPWISRKISKENFTLVKDVIKRLFILTSLVSLLVLCLTPELLGILAPPSYGDLSYLVFPIALSCPTLLLTSLTTTASLRYRGRLGIIISGVLPAISFVLINLLLLPRFGVICAAISVPLAYLVSFLIATLNLRASSKNVLINANDYLQYTLFFLTISAIIYNFISVISVRIIIAVIIFALFIILLIRSRGYIREGS